MRSVEEALAVLRMAGACKVTVVFDLGSPPSPALAVPPPEPSTAARSAFQEATDDPLYRSTSSRPVKVSPLAEEDDDGLD